MCRRWILPEWTQTLLTLPSSSRKPFSRTVQYQWEWMYFIFSSKQDNYPDSGECVTMETVPEFCFPSNNSSPLCECWVASHRHHLSGHSLTSFLSNSTRHVYYIFICANHWYNKGDKGAVLQFNKTLGNTFHLIYLYLFVWNLHTSFPHWGTTIRKTNPPIDLSFGTTFVIEILPRTSQARKWQCLSLVNISINDKRSMMNT